MSESSPSQNENPVPSEDASVAASAPASDLPQSVMAQAAGAAGLAVVSRNTITALVDLGVQANTYGLTKLASGGLICTIERLSEMQEIILDLARKSQSDKVKLAAATAFSGLAKSMHGCATAVNADGLAAEDKKAVKPRRRLASAAITVSPAQSS